MGVSRGLTRGATLATKRPLTPVLPPAPGDPDRCAGTLALPQSIRCAGGLGLATSARPLRCCHEWAAVLVARLLHTLREGIRTLGVSLCGSQAPLAQMTEMTTRTKRVTGTLLVPMIRCGDLGVALQGP
jgi:hypothetical protein